MTEMTRIWGAQLEAFGFCLVPGVSSVLVDKLEAASKMVLPNDVPAERETLFHAHNINPLFLEICGFKPLSDLLAYVGADKLVASESNVFVGDSFWHSDGFYAEGMFLRVALYFDDLTGDNGAIRFIPMSHRLDGGWQEEHLRGIVESRTRFGAGGELLPAVTVKSRRGDLLVFNTNVFHASWNGAYRRQCSWNFVASPKTKSEANATARFLLNRFVSGTVVFK